MNELFDALASQLRTLTRSTAWLGTALKKVKQHETHERYWEFQGKRFLPEFAQLCIQVATQIESDPQLLDLGLFQIFHHMADGDEAREDEFIDIWFSQQEYQLSRTGII